MTETDHGKPYTDADVENTARVLAALAYGAEDNHAPWHYTEFGVECICGSAVVSADDRCTADWDHMPEDGRDNLRAEARAVLDALTADGWRKVGPPHPTPIHVGDVPYFDPREAREDWRAAPIPGQPDWSHEIAFDSDGTWAISHPDGCPGQAGGCDVERLARLAADQLPRPHGYSGLPGPRYRCAVNDLGDRFLLGDSIDAADPLATAIEETQEVAAELADERTEHQATIALAGRLAAALTHAMRRLGGEGITPTTWAGWRALLAEQADRHRRLLGPASVDLSAPAALDKQTEALAAEHHLPLLDLTAAEVDALVRAADQYADEWAAAAEVSSLPADQPDPHLLTALDKLRTEG